MQRQGFDPGYGKVPYTSGKRSPCAITTGPTCNTAEACLPRTCALQRESHWNEKPRTTARQQPMRAATREKPQQQWRPNMAKTKINKNFKWTANSTTWKDRQPKEIRDGWTPDLYCDSVSSQAAWGAAACLPPCPQVDFSPYITMCREEKRFYLNKLPEIIKPRWAQPALDVSNLHLSHRCRCCSDL